jgi:hypothetical protein
MSDRSAKLLLEVAKMIEAKVTQDPHAFRKMGGGGDSITFRAGLVTEVQQWAKGYQENIDRKVALKKAGVLTEEIKRLFGILSGIMAVTDMLSSKEFLGFDEVKQVCQVLEKCQDLVHEQLKEKSNG